VRNIEISLRTGLFSFLSDETRILMAKPTCKALEQRVKGLEKEALEGKRAEEALLESSRRLQVAYDQAIVYAQELNDEIAERKRAEEALKKARNTLEERVEERTAELKREIAGRKRVQRALRESEELYRSFVQGFQGIAFRSRIDFTPIFFHGSVEEISGYTEDEFTGGNPRWDQVIHPDDLPTISESSKKISSVPDHSVEREYRIIHKDGDIRWVHEIIENLCDRSGKPIMVQGAIYDVTDRKRAEEEKSKLEAELQQVHKMEALGTLAGGIAHEFNNILWIIIGNTELALYEIPKRHASRQTLEEVLKACLHAEAVVKQILTFSRQTEVEKQPLQIGPAVEEGLSLLRASLPTTIEIRQKTECSSCTIMADPTQIHQVLINLCTNAAHAMREKGGVLEVSVVAIEFEEETVAQYPDLTPGSYLTLSVSDTGHGIDDKIIDRIFEPYFTTKGLADVTGMGLSVVHGIVKSHGGVIAVQSEQGKGTTFHIFFPIIDSEVVSKTKASRPVPRGNERILLVDDEKALADMGKKTLERLGYDVITTTNTTEAVDLFEKHHDKLDLVITDQTMPNMTGGMLAKELMRIRPDIPIILCTGYSEMITKDKARDMGIREFIMKPLVTRDLATTIRKVLDKG
jgi:PAS domain S-box-containing protein